MAIIKPVKKEKKITKFWAKLLWGMGGGGRRVRWD